MNDMSEKFYSLVEAEDGTATFEFKGEGNGTFPDWVQRTMTVGDMERLGNDLMWMAATVRELERRRSQPLVQHVPGSTSEGVRLCQIPFCPDCGF